MLPKGLTILEMQAALDQAVSILNRKEAPPNLDPQEVLHSARVRCSGGMHEVQVLRNGRIATRNHPMGACQEERLMSELMEGGWKAASREKVWHLRCAEVVSVWREHARGSWNNEGRLPPSLAEAAHDSNLRRRKRFQRNHKELSSKPSKLSKFRASSKRAALRLYLCGATDLLERYSPRVELRITDSIPTPPGCGYGLFRMANYDGDWESGPGWYLLRGNEVVLHTLSTRRDWQAAWSLINNSNNSTLTSGAL